MNQVERLVARAGGKNTELARLCGVHPSRVTHWKNSPHGVIPARYHQPILDTAKAENLPITAADFFDEPVDRKAKRKKREAA